MRLLHRIGGGLRSLFRSREVDAELDAELREFLQRSIDAKVLGGMSIADAERAALLELGTPEGVKDWVRDVGWERHVESLWQDLGYAVRVISRSPGFACAAVATLALGIGASTAIFSVAHGASLRPLPYFEPNRLLRLYESNPESGQLKHEVSIGAFQGWREGAPSLESAALFDKPRTRFLTGRESVSLTLMSVSPGIFDVLGIKPWLGGFKPEPEYTRYTADDDVVLSFAAWQRLFGGRPDVVGQQLELSGVGDADVVRVVGVMPEGFAFAEPVDAWRPTLFVELPINRLFRLWRQDRAIARVRPGASIYTVRAELEAVSARLARDYPQTNSGWTATVDTLHESIVGNFGRAVWLLLAAVVVVLLVACLNVAGLMIARAVARERETAMRIALGAPQSRLLRLCLVECSLLCASGAALGLCLAWWGVSSLKAAAPPGIPRLDDIAIDGPVFGVAAAATLLAIVISTVAPLAVTWRRDPANGLRGGAAGASEAPSRHLVRAGLIAAQCAGAVTLVILAMMLTRSFSKLTAVDLGWDSTGVLTLKVMPPMPSDLRRPWARYVEWSDRLLTRLEATPGIQRAALTTQIPLSPWFYPSSVARGRGKSASDEARWPVVAHVISDGYFDTMRIAVIGGRSFTRTDRFSVAQLIGADGAERERGVAIISESTARNLWPGRPAIGEALWLPDADNVTWREVVGIVEDIHFHAVGETPAMHVFVPWTQIPNPNLRLVVKGAGATTSMTAVIRDAVQEVAPGTHVDQIASLESLVSRATVQARFTTAVVALFGVAALVLAAVGITGTLSYVVRARRREIGIRLALGASRRAIVAQTLSRGLIPALGGGMLGLTLAVVIARLFRSLFFEISPLDLSSYLLGAVILLAVSLGAALGPARHAAQLDPATTLRSE